MNEAELRACATCALCGKGFGHTGLPLFWRVTVERYGVDINAVKRQDGLAAFLNSSVLADVMGPGEQMAKPVMDPVKITLCEHCAIHGTLPVAAIAEIGREHNADTIHPA